MDEQNNINEQEKEQEKEHEGVQIIYEDKKQQGFKIEQKHLKNILLIISCIINIILFIIVLNSVFFTKVNFRKVQKCNLVKEIITNLYYEDINEDDLIEGCIKGMTYAVNDVYTTYFSKDEMKMYTQSNSNKYEGLGVSVLLKDDRLLTVMESYEDSPAYNAGIRPGDKIIKIKDTDITGIRRLEDVAPLFEGELGDKIKMEIKKAKTGEIVEVELEISEIEFKQVTSEILDNDIGYIKISMFNTDVSKMFKEHLEKLKEQNIKGLLIDLRDNLGGDYYEVLEIADTLLDKDSLIIYTMDKTNTKECEYAKGDGLDMPIGVLVNGESASASEVLAGALKDNNKAWLLGNKTFGKGVVQSIMEFKDGSGLKITTARYFTPSGECIDGKGIEPNYNVDLPEEYKYSLISNVPREYDTQLDEALKIMREEV